MTRTQLKKWIRGIIGGAIGGVSNSFIAVIVDPAAFDITTYGGAARLLVVFSWAAGFGAALFLRQHPLPDEDADGVPLPLCPTCGRPVSMPHEEHV